MPCLPSVPCAIRQIITLALNSTSANWTQEAMSYSFERAQSCTLQLLLTLGINLLFFSCRRGRKLRLTEELLPARLIHVCSLTYYDSPGKVPILWIGKLRLRDMKPFIQQHRARGTGPTPYLPPLPQSESLTPSCRAPLDPAWPAKWDSRVALGA